MGLKLSRKIYCLRNSILLSIKKLSPLLYKLLILIGAVFKFLYNISKKKNFKILQKI